MTKLAVHVVLDRSGSMQSIKSDTIGAFNSYVETLAKESPDSVLSLTLFDDQAVDTIITNRKISDVPELTDKEFVPRGMTPLYDAIGKVSAKLEDTDAELKALVILTDGQENCSREFTKSSIKTLLEEKQAEKSWNAPWLVIYLGADQDAFAEGSAFGANRGTTMDFAKSAKGVHGTMVGAAGATMRYMATGQLQNACFTAEERKEAAG